MGYHVHANVGAVRFAPKREAEALAEIKRWAAAVAKGVAGFKLRRAATLDDAFGAIGFTVDRDDDGVLVGFDYEGGVDELFDELPQLFAGLARFVIAGSELELQGEQGERYRFVFNGRRCRHEITE